MINVKDQVYDAIKSMCSNISDIYPSDWATLPAIQYIEEDNIVHEFTDNKEQSALIRYRFDIWHDANTTEYAVELDERVSALGLKRIQSIDLDDTNNFKHKQMRYEGIIDVDTLHVYHKLERND